MWLIVIVLVYLAWKSVHERRWAWVWGSLCAMKLKPFLKIIKWCWTFLVIIFNDLDCEYVNVLRYLGNTVQSHSCVSIISFFLRVHGCAYSLLWKASDEWKKHKYNRVPRREKNAKERNREMRKNAWTDKSVADPQRGRERAKKSMSFSDAQRRQRLWKCTQISNKAKEKCMASNGVNKQLSSINIPYMTSWWTEMR